MPMDATGRGPEQASTTPWDTPSPPGSPNPSIEAVDAAIRARRTVKVFHDPDAPAAKIPAGFNQSVEAILDVAGWAPFHKAAHARHRQGDQASIVPWRFHWFDAHACHALIRRIEALSKTVDEPIWQSAPKSKIPKMLSAAGAMVLVTWLPDPEPTTLPGQVEAARRAEHQLRNDEHLAAAAAASQNLLLAATARGMASYWSSGGVLRTERALELCGILTDQSLLGAIFLFPEPLGAEGEDYVTGKLRDLRGPVEGWSRRVEVGEIPSNHPVNSIPDPGA